MMITKQDLRRYRGLKREALQLNRRMKELELMAISPKAQALTGMPGGSTHSHSGIENLIIKLADAQERYAKKMSEALTEAARIEDSLRVLAETERELIREYYFEGHTWERVACDMGYSWKQIHRIHNKCLLKLQNDIE